MIEFIPSYNDLCTEIDMLELRIEDMERERDYLRKSMYDNAPINNLGAIDYSREIVQNGYVPMPLDKITDRMKRIDHTLDDLRRLKSGKEKYRKAIEKKLDSLEGLAYKVAYMRDLKKMRLREIAEELGYSLVHIKRISSKINK
ncbi:hypothetical protein BEP19_15940 [Ammoniphilus oxalaticus]|uniref:RNA polymerase sigma-70 region 4 domain-containing protein n=1 Tax=Ammoniphilus oxalaticus TaxID=66863 RepID=A0A419SQC6_9BACL|nr:hypothetical protein [Ammoniphilus oxalaticus]RKD26696.1 hypothetical protein BEP19_15940 [Ammoniphilus oxalaticus]